MAILDVKQARSVKTSLSQRPLSRKSQAEYSLKPSQVFSSQAPLTSLFIQGNGMIALDDVAGRFCMSKGQLAETIGLSREAVYKATRAHAIKTQSRVRDMLDVVGRVAEWAGGEQQAMAWYKGQPLPAFGDRTAESLVKSGKAGAVRDYLDSLALGGFA